MATGVASPPRPGAGDAGVRRGGRSVARVLARHPGLRLGALLSLPALWLVVAYLGSLAAMFVTAFWTTDTFTGNVVRTVTLENFQTLLGDPVYRAIALRTVGVAAAVTVVDGLVALPVAFYMAKVAGPRGRQVMVVAILTPLWASYLVKAYSWRVMLGENGAINWALHPFGLSGPGYGLFATVLDAGLPVAAVHDPADLRRPRACARLAARGVERPRCAAGRTYRSIVLPLLFPAIVAGSIFTFSLSLGDYITVKIVGGATQLFANVIYDNVGTANNLPFAAAAATFPVVMMVIYLVAVRRTGALDNL